MRSRLFAEARRGGGALFFKKNYGYEGSCTAFQRFKCNYLASECEDKVQSLEEKMGSLHTEVQGLRAEVSALHQGAAAWWANIDKHSLQAPLKKITSLHADMSGLICETASLIRGDLDSHRDSVQSLLSGLQEDMSKGQKEQVDLCTRMNATESCISADITSMRKQAAEDMEALHESLRTFHDDMLAFESSLKDMVEQLKFESTKIAPYDMETAKIGSLQEQVTGLRADLASIGDLGEQMAKEIKEEMTGLRADVAKACHTEADGKPLICLFNDKIDLFDTRMSAQYANIMFKLSSIDGMDMVIKELKADMALLVAEGSADVAKVEKCLSKIMHAEMEQLYRIVATTKSDVLKIRSNVFAQEKSIMEAQELSHKLLSNVESYARSTTDMERANAILVKVASAVLGCTTAFYAWTVWSSNSCYPI